MIQLHLQLTILILRCCSHGQIGLKSFLKSTLTCGKRSRTAPHAFPRARPEHTDYSFGVKSTHKWNKAQAQQVQEESLQSAVLHVPNERCYLSFSFSSDNYHTTSLFAFRKTALVICIPTLHSMSNHVWLLQQSTESSFSSRRRRWPDLDPAPGALFHLTAVYCAQNSP